MDIKVKINPLHNANYHLDMNFDGINMGNAKEVFDEFAMELRSMFTNQGEESFNTYIRQK